MKRARLLFPAAGLAACVFAAGCGGTRTGEPVATTKITMVKSYRFAPDVIAITAGRTVTWKNDDNFTHTVRVDGQDDHTVKPGDSVSITFDKPGTYHYVCTLHSKDMAGEVIVT